MTNDSGTEQLVTVEVHDGWASVVLNRPHRKNALTGPLVEQLRAAVDQLAADEAVAAIVLRGAEGALCSGVDLTEYQRSPQPDWVASFGENWRQANMALFRCPCPIIVALERYGINAGSALALSGDVMIAGESAFLQVGEIRQGAPMPMNAAWFQLRASHAAATRLALYGDRVPAAELFRLGLAHEVVADDGVRSRAEELAAQMASFPAGSSRQTKAVLREPGIDPELLFPAASGTPLASVDRVGGES